MKMNRFLFAVGVSLAMALTFSCTEDSSDEEPSSASEGDSSSSLGTAGNLSSSGPGISSSSSSEPIAAGVCVIDGDYDYDEPGRCYSGFTNSECSTLDGRIRSTCPEDYENSKACFVTDEYWRSCYTGYNTDDDAEYCEDEGGIIMEFSTCMRNEGAFISGRCIHDYSDYGYGEECYDTSKYSCQGGVFTAGATCPLGACYIYDYNTGDERCEDGFSRSECYLNEGSFSSETCPIQFCAYEEDDEMWCEQLGLYPDSVKDADECADEYYGGFLTQYPEDYCIDENTY
jgi:hypothetical protein